MNIEDWEPAIQVLPAALPSEDEAARAIARASDVEWDYNPEDPEDTYRRDARAVLALIPPQRCAPSEDEVAEAVAEASGGTVGTLTSRAQKIARAVLGLFAAQPTVAQVKAEAWDEGRESVAADFARPIGENGMRPSTPNPYRRSRHDDLRR